MATRKKPLPTAGTLPDLLLTLTALSGEFPTSLVSRLPASGSYKAYTVNSSNGKISFAPTIMPAFAACA